MFFSNILIGYFWRNDGCVWGGGGSGCPPIMFDHLKGH
jgi:hypothetical protein